VALATATTDVSHILRAINPNSNWKNSSAKLNKTIAGKTLNNSQKPKKCLMTEEDIDRLFNKSKSKSRVDTQPTRINTKTNITELQPVKTEMHPIVVRVPRPIKDFANSVKFLKMDDSTDKLLNGMPVFDDELDE
jgi:hypothetical protein